jgi:hypothetical protein
MLRSLSFFFNPPPRCFERDLEELVIFEQKQFPNQFDGIPMNLCLPIEILEQQTFQQGFFQFKFNQNKVFSVSQEIKML